MRFKVLSIGLNLVMNIAFIYIAFNLLERAEYYNKQGHFYDYTGWVTALFIVYILVLTSYFWTGSFLFLITLLGSIRFLFTAKDMFSWSFESAEYYGNRGVSGAIAQGLLDEAQLFYNWAIAICVMNVICLFLVIPLRKRRKKALAKLSLGT